MIPFIDIICHCCDAIVCRFVGDNSVLPTTYAIMMAILIVGGPILTVTHLPSSLSSDLLIVFDVLISFVIIITPPGL